jgi:hypothetical protein
MLKIKYKLLPILVVIEMDIRIQDHWIARPQQDGWLVPEEEYDKILGRPN